MTAQLKEYVNGRFSELIRHITSGTEPHDIIVLMGLSDIVDLTGYEDCIVDPQSFGVDGDSTVFDEDQWFARMFIALRKERRVHILSYQQFVYYTSYAPNLTTTFNSRVCIIYDNVRALFPIKADSFLEKTVEDGMEERPENLPIYQAEQVSIDGVTYCAYVAPSGYDTKALFNKSVEIDPAGDGYDEMLEINEHMYSLDVFLNKALLNPEEGRVLGVKRTNDMIRAEEFHKRLKLANGLLQMLGSWKIVMAGEKAIPEEYVPKEDTVNLLKRYWGPKSKFRDIKVYKRPGESSEIVAISQGQVVDTIIGEYEKSRKDKNVLPDDVFITAPTGSGKSLLFQLPGFYVSECGDVTIVVSPLIALMKDQVIAIKRDRKFDKVAYINSELNLIDRDHVINQCKDGKIDILYMSPELLLSYDISYFIGDRRLGLMVVDEAHLITTWGRDFRVDYWHLGNHINKIRKYRGFRFPMVALTATAIYGGPNDMVVDSMGSLFMHNPHLYLGQVKRENIRFVINNYEAFTSGYKRNKLDQTVAFIKDVDQHHLKTVVYAPFTTHVRDIMEQVKDIAVPYFGQLPADQKDFSYSRFKSNEKLIMVCTKAFGMGVDIPDVQVIYHHAPSGLLPDYVQEVGRVARDPKMIGFAALNFHEKDKQFSKMLFGMSALHEWQLREVLKKIYSMYDLGGKKRNMLVSSEDFEYIFNDEPDAESRDRKIKTALMMIEKDYLMKVRYNALIARPKQMFVKCYARTNAFGMSVLEKRYSGFYKKLRDLGGGAVVVELDLDEIWKKDFTNLTFAAFKKEYYNGNLLRKDGADLIALTKFTLSLAQDFSEVGPRFFDVLDALEKVFDNILGVFTEEDFISKLGQHISDSNFCKKLARFVLASFSGRMLDTGVIEGNAFLQRRENTNVTYRVFSVSYKASFATMKRILTKMFEGTDSRTVTRYSSNENDLSLTYTRLGSILEMMELATYECKGGDNPMIFVRINDPRRIHWDANNPNYKNELLSRTKKRHKISNDIFDHFFTNTFSSDERWDYIEDFFLGATNDELFAKFPENDERNHVDIVEYITENIKSVDHDKKAAEEGVAVAEFPPRPDEFYSLDSLLTIEGRTLNMQQWILQDPVSFDIVRRKHDFHITKDDLKLLYSKLRVNHNIYYKEMMGLKMPIEFKGYPGTVPASIPYTSDLVGFYKWWKKPENTDKVILSKRDQIQLFVKVYQKEPSALLVKHKKMINQ